MLLQLGAGFAIAGGVAYAARRAGSLDDSGAWGATLVGGVSVAAGWAWGALLIGWFVASSALTHLGAARKSARTGRTLADASARNATQVFANGGVFALAAVLGWDVAALGALAAAAADTWSTEIGLLWGGVPHSVLSGRVVEPGLSGGITLAGSLGGALGALLVSVAAALLFTGAPWLGIAAAGIVGGLADSLLGASVQTQRRCPRCDALTERLVHDCGSNTEHARGLRWMSNDAVNFAATVVGAVAAATLTNI